MPDGERTMSEAELPNLYKPEGYIANGPINRRQLVDQIATVVGKLVRKGDHGSLVVYAASKIGR